MKNFKKTVAFCIATAILCSLSFACSKQRDIPVEESNPSGSYSQPKTDDNSSLSSLSASKTNSQAPTYSTERESDSLISSDSSSAIESSSLSQLKPPSEILNLTNWKITLPIMDKSTGKALEIKQPDLNGYFNANYFAVNQQSDGVVFTAPVEGFTTTGSSYPRSELREMTDNGTKNASWDTMNGTHIMTVTQAITHTPDYKKHVVAGQIHDDSDDVITFRLENKKLFIDLNGTDGPTLDSSYTLGTAFTVKFVAGNNGIMCYYNGKYVYTHQVSATGCFFKAGVYTQSNLSKGDKVGAYGQTIIYGLNVEHYSSAPNAPEYYQS